jgi:amidase
MGLISCVSNKSQNEGNPSMPNNEICYMDAVEIVKRIASGQLSAKEVMEAHIAQIERINPKVNAIVTFLPEQAMESAEEADRTRAKGGNIGPLSGIPIAHKDLTDTKGIRTTKGSPIFKDNIPDKDALIVERLKNAGAITIGKTNTPEFGAGSQTYNEVFGETLNPYDLTKTCGGSSGGAAVALACGMIPLADGSDLGGSLRNPAGFCNVVGFRTSPGRVPVWPAATLSFPFGVEGPMARSVQDIALMLSVIAGPDPRVPMSITEPGDIYARPLERDFKGTRIAWSRDLNGVPVDERVTAVIDGQRQAFEDLGCVVVDNEPDFSDADEIFKVWRAWNVELTMGSLLDTHRDQIKETVIWNAEMGRQLTGPEIGRAEVKRAGLYHRMMAFMEDHEFLILPVSQVPPFDIKKRVVEEINGIKMETYIDWMKSCYYISATGHPAISVPCGFTQEGLPVGVQIVGRRQDELGVLQLAHAFEKQTQVGQRRPTL